MKVVDKRHLYANVEAVDVEGNVAKCLACETPLKRVRWSGITTKDLDVLELDRTVYNLEVVQKCEKCGHLNRMVYADNLSDETLMKIEKAE